MSESSALPNSCPQCGAVLPSEATAGLCPRCILAQAMQPVPAGAEEPAALDVTMRVAPPVSTGTAKQEVDLPLPEELTNLLPHGNYSVEGFLGQGGMGAVYKGTQVRLKRPVAIKIMRRDLGKDYDFEQRFEREAQAMAKLNHPNIVSVIDFGEAGPDYLYIVMELVDGADLMDVIRGGQMTQEMALTLLPQICDALQFAHDHGIVHRDIKPSNIMLTRDGRIKMADFGLAKRFDAESSFRTQTGTGMGTPDYAAPEQFDPTCVIDHRADIYALGVMIYQMITGQLPRGVWKPPSQRAEVAPQWDAIVSRAMQSDPSDRYQQAREVKTDVSSIPLADCSRVRKAVTEAPPEKAPTSTPAKSRLPLWLGSLALAAVIAVGVFFALQQAEKRGPVSPQSEMSSAAALAAASAKTGAPQWKTVELSDEEMKKRGASKENGMLIVPSNKGFPILHSKDGAVRAEATWRTQAGNVSIDLRFTEQERYYLSFDNAKITLLYYTRPGQPTEMIKQVPLPKMMQNGERFVFEVAVIGSTIRARVNGTTELSVIDDRARGTVAMGTIGSNDIAVGKVEYLNLDGVPNPEAVLGWGTPTPAVAKPTTPGSAVAAPSSQTKRTIDLLPLVDLKRDVISGTWTQVNGSVLVDNKHSGTGSPRLQFTYEPPEEYDYEFEFTVNNTGYGFGVVTPVQGHSVSALLGYTPGGYIGFEMVGGQRANSSDLHKTGLSVKSGIVFEPGKRHLCRAEVRKNALGLWLDDQKIVDWKGDPGTVRSHPNETMNNGAAAGLFANNRSVTFHSARIREITGTGKVNGGGAPAGDAAKAGAPQWKTVVLSEEERKKVGASEENGMTVFSIKDWPFPLPHFKDGAVRAEIAWRDKTWVSTNADLRVTPQGRYVIKVATNSLELFYTQPDKPMEVMKRVPLPQPLRNGERFVLEVAVIGSAIRARVNGATELSVIDDRAKGTTAMAGFITNDVAFGKVEYLNLDGVANPEAVLGWGTPKPAAGVTPAQAMWKKVPLTSEQTAQAAKNDGWIKQHRWYLSDTAPDKRFKDGAVRLRYRWEKDSQIFLSMRRQQNNDRHVFLGFRSDGNLWLDNTLQAGESETRLVKASRVLASPLPGSEGTLELAVIGNKAYGRLNDVTLFISPLPDDLGAGTFDFGNGYGDRLTAVKDVEYLNLDGVPNPEAVLGWGTPTSAAPPSLKAAVSTPAWLKEAQTKGGRLRAFGKDGHGEINLSHVAAFTDFQQVALGKGGWMARRAGGDAYGTSGLGQANWKTTDQGPFPTRFLQHTNPVYVKLSADEGWRNIYVESSQTRKDLAHPDAVAILNALDHIVVLARDGTMLFNQHWSGTKKEGRISPPADFFLGATAHAFTDSRYFAARPGGAVQSWSVDAGTRAEVIQAGEDIVEMTGFNQGIILRTASGRVLVITNEGTPTKNCQPPATLGPAIAVRAGNNLCAAQMTDGTWVAWGESPERIEQTKKIGPALDVGYESGYMLWVEPPTAGAEAAGLSPPVPQQWTDATASARASVSPELTEVADGGWRAKDLVPVARVSITKPKNALLRLRHQGQVTLTLRMSPGLGTYTGNINSLGRGSLDFYDYIKFKEGNLKLAEGPVPPGFKMEASHETMMAVQGDHLSLWLDGQLVVSTKDSRLTEGYTQFRVEKGTIIEKVEYADLPDDVPPPARQ